jgi:hypothetical protein
MGTVTCPLLLTVLDGGIFTSTYESKDSILYLLRQSTLSGFSPAPPSIIETIMTSAKPRVRFAPLPTGARSGPEFDKLIPLIEARAALGLGILTVRCRLHQFCLPSLPST